MNHRPLNIPYASGWGRLVHRRPAAGVRGVRPRLRPGSGAGGALPLVRTARFTIFTPRCVACRPPPERPEQVRSDHDRAVWWGAPGNTEAFSQWLVIDELSANGSGLAARSCHRLPHPIL